MIQPKEKVPEESNKENKSTPSNTNTFERDFMPTPIGIIYEECSLIGSIHEESVIEEKPTLFELDPPPMEIECLSRRAFAILPKQRPQSKRRPQSKTEKDKNAQPIGMNTRDGYFPSSTKNSNLLKKFNFEDVETGKASNPHYDSATANKIKLSYVNNNKHPMKVEIKEAWKAEKQINKQLAQHLSSWNPHGEKKLPKLKKGGQKTLTKPNELVSIYGPTRPKTVKPINYSNALPPSSAPFSTKMGNNMNLTKMGHIPLTNGKCPTASTTATHTAKNSGYQQELGTVVYYSYSGNNTSQTSPLKHDNLSKIGNISKIEKLDEMDLQRIEINFNKTDKSNSGKIDRNQKRLDQKVEQMSSIYAGEDKRSSNMNTIGNRGLVSLTNAGPPSLNQINVAPHTTANILKNPNQRKNLMIEKPEKAFDTLLINYKASIRDEKEKKRKNYQRPKSGGIGKHGNILGSSQQENKNSTGYGANFNPYKHLNRIKTATGANRKNY